MKNNQEKLTDAIGMLREDTLNTCMTPTKTSARALTRRRVAVLLAACLAFALVAGAMLVLPFLRSEDPLAATESQTDPAPTLSGLSWYDAPLVNVQVLALTAEDTNGLDMIETQDISVVQGNRLVNQRVYVLFKLDEGETLTVTSHNGKIARTILPESDTDDSIYGTWEKKFLRYTSVDCVETTTAEFQIEIDSPEVFLTWGGNRYYTKDPLAGTPDEDFIDFVVRNADGHITGAGSVYLGNRKTVTNTESRYYDPVSISRGKVLGSVRFRDPASVTEEQVDTFLESLHAKADGLRETLFEDLTRSEQFVMTLGDLINTRYSHLNNFAMASGGSIYDNYVSLTIYEEEDSVRNSTNFLLMEDGTWSEIARRLSFCEYCGVQVGACSHRELEHDRFLLTDGRVMDIHSGVINNHSARTLVEVTDTTYKPCTEYDLIESLMAKDSPMVDPVYQAYIALKAELGEGTLVYDVSRFVRFLSDGTIQWNRYAILRVKGGDGKYRDYFVHENGAYAELASIRYGCSDCSYTAPRESAIEVHGHGSTALVFILTNGGRYTVRDGLNNGQAYEPEFTP